MSKPARRGPVIPVAAMSEVFTPYMAPCCPEGDLVDSALTRVGRMKEAPKLDTTTASPRTAVLCVDPIML